MKHLKRINALVLALMMVLSMGASVFADDNTFNGGTEKGQQQENADRSGESLGTNTTLVFEKAIKLVDADDSFYIPNVPNIAFTYTVAPQTVASGTRASDGLTATDVKTGVGTVSVSAVDTANTFTNGVKFVNNAEGNAISNIGTDDAPIYIVKENLKLDFSSALSAATQPGVYRYKITEAATLSGNDANKGYDYSADVVVTDEDARYVDMYVRWKENANPAVLEIYGYTMFKDTPSYNPTTVPADVVAQYKTDGFTYDKSTTNVTLKTDQDEEDEREYSVANDLSGMTTFTAYDLVVRKTVTGAMADKSREFDIDVLIDKLPNDDGVFFINDNNVYTTPAAAIAALKLTAVQTAVGGGATSAGTVSGNKATIAGAPTLRHDEYMVVKGIPSGVGSQTATKYDVMEDAAATSTSGDGYQMSYLHNTITQADPTDSYTNIVANHGNIASGGSAMTATFAMSKEANKNAFYVDNDLEAISPTNVVMRFAPYLFILGGAMLLLFASRRRKAEQE